MNWTIAKYKTPKALKPKGGFSESDYLLCIQKDISVPFVGWYNLNNKTWHVAHHKADSDPVEVTHWMPLPEPPKE